MKFNTDDLLEIIRLSTQDDLSSRHIASMYGCSKSTINYFLSKETYSDFWEEYDNKPFAGGSVVSPIIERLNINDITDKKTFILTSAQNNTYVHDAFWNALNVCAKYYDAEILVSTFTYNKSGFQNLTKGSDELWYDPKIRDYIVNESVQLCDDLVFSGELNILPTAVNPLSGLSNYTNDDSCVVPHAKVNLESVATAKHKDTKFMYTTGAVTQSNYIEKKAGQKAAHHHIYSALLVEVDSDGTWFARHLIGESDTGCFYDLDVLFTPECAEGSHRVLAINWGDVHVEKLDPIAGVVSFGISVDSEGSLPYKVDECESCMLDDLMPEYSIYHDIIDFKVRNHHNRNDPLFKIQMFHDETEEVSYGLRQCGEFLHLNDRDWCQQVVVNSNHDAALKRWVIEADWKQDPVNSEFLLQCQLSLVKAVKRSDNDYCIFESAVKGLHGSIDDVKFLRLDESFMIGSEHGIECGYHSHTGANGARGSVNSYRLAGLRYNLGHSHAATIKDGVYQAGVTGKLDMGYNIGLSSWSHSHILTYQNTKRTIITIKNSKYKVNR